MPSKASLPSALVDPIDNPPQIMDSGGRLSKQSSSRSKISSNSSQADNPLLRPFKSFKKKTQNLEEQSAVASQISDPSNSILYRRPSLVVTSDIENQNVLTDGLKPPEAINLTPPSPAPSLGFLKAPSFLKVMARRQKRCLFQSKSNFFAANFSLIKVDFFQP